MPAPTVSKAWTLDELREEVRRHGLVPPETVQGAVMLLSYIRNGAEGAPSAESSRVDEVRYAQCLVGRTVRWNNRSGTITEIHFSATGPNVHTTGDFPTYEGFVIEARVRWNHQRGLVTSVPIRELEVVA